MKIIDFLNDLIFEGWKQKEIAEKCGYTPQHINRMLKKNYADIKAIEKIAKAFNKPLSMFLEEEAPQGRYLNRDQELLLDTIGEDRELIREMIRCAEKEKLYKMALKQKSA